MEIMEYTSKQVIPDKQLPIQVKMEKEIMKVFFSYPKLPQETSFYVVHLYSISEFGKTSFTLGNCISIVKNISGLRKRYADLFLLTINHLQMLIHRPEEEVYIGKYETHEVVGAKHLGNRISPYCDVFVIKTMSCLGYDCPTFHFFTVPENQDKSAIEKICRCVNKCASKAQSTVIAHMSDISCDHVYVDRLRFEKHWEQLSHCFCQFQDAISILANSIHHRSYIPKDYKTKKYQTIKNRCILRRAGGLLNSELKKLIQMIRYSLNLIHMLKSFLYKPNFVDLVHSLFSCLVIFSQFYGIERVCEIETPFLNNSTVRMLSSCLTSEENEFLDTLGTAWANSYIGETNADLKNDMFIPKLYESNVGFAKEKLKYGYPEENDGKLLSLSDYRIARCNFNKIGDADLTLRAGDIIMIILLNDDTCFARNFYNEYGYVKLKLLTSSLGPNFYADFFMRDLYNRMKTSIPPEPSEKASSYEKSNYQSTTADITFIASKDVLENILKQQTEKR